MDILYTENHSNGVTEKIQGKLCTNRIDIVVFEISNFSNKQTTED